MNPTLFNCDATQIRKTFDISATIPGLTGAQMGAVKAIGEKFQEIGGILVEGKVKPEVANTLLAGLYNQYLATVAGTVAAWDNGRHSNY